MQKKAYDIAIVGTGLVGTAVAFGLANSGHEVLLLDENDSAQLASRGNFGLVWVQGKGLGKPAYSKLTRKSSDQWPNLAAMLDERSGIDVAYRRCGGLEICMNDAELMAQTAELEQLRKQPAPGANEAELIDASELRKLVPSISQDARGACYCPLDAEVNPLLLLRALHASFKQAGGTRVSDARVTQIHHDRHFRLSTQAGDYACTRLILAAGLGNNRLAPQVGLSAPVEPVRGQVLVTSRLPRFLDVPTLLARQTTDGTVMLGDTHERVGQNTLTTVVAAKAIAERACRTFPVLKSAQLVRQWAALRVMPPDGYPIYAQSQTHPGASVVCCHSGVTLAAAHAFDIAPALLAETLGSDFPEFATRDLDQAA